MSQANSPMCRSDYEEFKQAQKIMLYQQQQYQQKYGSSDSVNIVHEILCDQDLSRAGNLFSLSNDLLLKSFPTTLRILKNMIDNRKYVNNLNEQSICEIVLTKCMVSSLNRWNLALSSQIKVLLSTLTFSHALPVLPDGLQTRCCCRC